MYSIVIPTHERSDLLALCVSSTLQQTCKPSEVIIVDDASSELEKKKQIISNLQSQTDVKLVFKANQKNMGACFTRNRGAEIVQTPFVAFLDDDDLWLERKAQIQLPFLKKGYKITCGQAIIRQNDGNEVITNFGYKGSALKAMLRGNFVCSPTNLISLTAFKTAGGFNTKYHALQDRDLWTRMLKLEESIMVCDDLVAVYLKHNGPSIGKGSNVKSAYKQYMIDHLGSFIKKYEIIGAIRNVRQAL